MGFDFNLTARSSTPTIGAFEFDPAFANAWTGASSTDWNTTSNWSAVAIPDQTAGVLIPANCPLYPVVSNAPANPATVSDITIEEGATLTVAPAQVASRFQETLPTMPELPLLPFNPMLPLLVR
jgi:hypothetical protein